MKTTKQILIAFIKKSILNKKKFQTYYIGFSFFRNNMYVDFGLIKYQCSCSFKNALNAQLIYSLSRNPGYDKCGTAIQIKEINGSTYRMPCTQSTAPPSVFSSQTTTVELACNDQPHCKDTGYCLLVLSNSGYY